MIDAARRRTLLGASGSGLLLLRAAPSPSQALADLRSATAATDPYGPLVSAVALLAWLLAGWLLLTVLLALAGRLPGSAGRLSAGACRLVAPTAVRRAVELALGLTVAVTVLGASSASAAGPAPAGGAVPSAAVGPATQSGPDLDWPAPSPTTRSPRPPVAPARQAVLVRPGDTLWGLAEQSLRAAGDPEPTDRAVARAWPAWWAANRAAVGDDPDLLRPGTRLAPPGADASSS